MIKKYRKKPVTIEAIVWTGLNTSEIKEFCGDIVQFTYYDSAWKAHKGPAAADLCIKTLEGEHHASIGDYIIRGVQGEFYPCKPDIFKKTYEEVLDG